jgi:hypothetical protein
VRFVLHAYDYTDAEALSRRLAVRPAHFEGVRALKAAGHFLLGGALLSPDGQMIGSMMLLDFPDEDALNAYLATEPYLIGNVWERVDVKPFQQADV